MTLEPELLEFSPADPTPVVDSMRELSDTRNGWVNLHPLVGDDQLPRNSMGFFGWLSARGPALPQATWVPGPPMRRDPSLHEPDSIGLQHPGGPKARFRLAELGAPIPDGWRVRSDHPRRGLVVELPDDIDPSAVVAWLLHAANVLTTLPMPDSWIAAVYRR